jgi:hypothetical protein
MRRLQIRRLGLGLSPSKGGGGAPPGFAFVTHNGNGVTHSAVRVYARSL